MIVRESDGAILVHASGGQRAGVPYREYGGVGGQVVVGDGGGMMSKRTQYVWCGVRDYRLGANSSWSYSML